MGCVRLQEKAGYSCPSRAYRFFIQAITGEERRRIKANIRKANEIGRETKMEKLPFEMRRDWRNACSIMGPRINPKIKGDPSNFTFRMR